TYRGFLFNYYDTTSLERTSNFISFVDSSWLTAALMVVRQTFPVLAERCAPLLAQQDYRFFYDESRGRLSPGYYVHLRSPARPPCSPSERRTALPAGAASPRRGGPTAPRSPGAGGRAGPRPPAPGRRGRRTTGDGRRWAVTSFEVAGTNGTGRGTSPRGGAA